MNMVQQGYDKVIQTINDARAVWTFIALIIAGVVGAVGWVYTEFPTAMAMETTHQQIVKEMNAVHEKQAAEMSTIRNMLKEKIQSDKLDTVNLAIKNNDAEQFQIEQWMKVNGSDQQSQKRLKTLKTEREELVIRRNCVISGNRVCE